MLILNAIKPVGERLVLNVVKENVTPQTFSFSIDIDHNYILTSIEITKTISELVNSELIVSFGRDTGGESKIVKITSIAFAAGIEKIVVGERKTTAVIFDNGTFEDPLVSLVKNKKHSLIVEVKLISDSEDKKSASCVIVGNFIRLTDLVIA